MRTCDVWGKCVFRAHYFIAGPTIRGYDSTYPVRNDICCSGCTHLSNRKWVQMIILKDLTNIFERIRLSSTKLVLMIANLAPMLPRVESAKVFPITTREKLESILSKNETDNKSFEVATYCIYPSRAASFADTK